ncbi:MAG: tRNA pseudouridine(55) synthase TruB [Escherichia coli]|nr:MAG: tRNA pseudouridine(55) synthase TruB [Escherichia coli]
MTGLICLNKPKDITSFSAVAKVRGITREKKCGHTGTLDPMATGVLPIMLGGATRFIDFLPDSDKGYVAEFKLGVVTDTLDITGEVLEENNFSVTKEEMNSVLLNFKGTISQIPPMYSAVSVDGQRLYDLARKGIEVERQARKVEVKELELLEFDEETGIGKIEVLCSKGTYIRSIIDDFGKKLGCGATMISLVRTKAMGIDLSECISLEELQNIKDTSNDFSSVVVSVEKLFECYPQIFVSEAQSRRFSNGGSLMRDRLKKNLKDGIYRVYSNEKIFLGLGELSEQDLKIKRLLTKRD